MICWLPAVFIVERAVHTSGAPASVAGLNQENKNGSANGRAGSGIAHCIKNKFNTAATAMN